MDKGDLCVFFYRGSKAEDAARLDKLEQVTRKVVPHVISVITSREWGHDRTRAPRSDTVYNHSVNGSNPVEAVQTMKTQNRGRKMVLVTLCEDMMKAADREGIRIITSGPTDQKLNSVRTVIPTPDGISHALRDIRFERN